MSKISTGLRSNQLRRPCEAPALEVLNNKDDQKDQLLPTQKFRHSGAPSAGSTIKRTLLTLLALSSPGTTLAGSGIASRSGNLLRGREHSIDQFEDFQAFQTPVINSSPYRRKLLWSAIQEVETYHPTLPIDFDIRSTGLRESSNAGHLSKAQARYINRMIAQSPTLTSQLKDALSKNVQILWVTDDRFTARYYPRSNTIWLNPKPLIEFDWKQLRPKHKLSLTGILLNRLSHELGHANDRSAHQYPQPSSYSTEAEFIEAYIEWATAMEATASYNTLVFKQELLENSGLSLYVNGGGKTDSGYGNSIYQEMMLNETMPLKDKLRKLAAEQLNIHPDLDPNNGLYVKTAAHIWHQHKRTQEL